MSFYSRNITIISLILLAFTACQKQKLLPERKLISDKPATKFEEAYPIGNGRIGGMVYGGIHNDRISREEGKLIEASVIPDFNGSFIVLYGDASKEIEGVQGRKVNIRF